MSSALYPRLALILASAASSHYTCTSPNPAPPKEEQEKYKSAAATTAGESGFTILHAASICKCTSHIINLIDLISLLSYIGFPIAHKPLPFLPRDIRDPTARTIPSPIVIGTVLMCIGTAVRLLAYNHLGRHFTFQLSLRKGHKLVTGGPYSIVRHPSYTGATVYLVGTAMSLLGPGSVYAELGLWRNALTCVLGACLAAMLSYLMLGMCIRMPNEDLALKKEFQGEWEEYAKRTPYRLIPGVY